MLVYEKQLAKEQVGELVNFLIDELKKDNLSNIALKGELGSGKTTLVQNIAKKLGIKEDVQSPTFIFEKIYNLDNEVWKKMVHIDAYRLEDVNDYSFLKLEEKMQDENSLVLIEWPEFVNINERHLLVHIYECENKDARIYKVYKMNYENDINT